MKTKRVVFLCNLLFAFLLLAGSSGAIAAQEASRRGNGGPSMSQLKKLHQRMTRERDHGRKIFENLSLAEQRAYTEVQKVKRVIVGDVKIQRARRPSDRGAAGRVVTAQAACTGSSEGFEVSIEKVVETWVGDTAYKWGLHVWYCRADGWRIDGVPEWWPSFTDNMATFYDRGVKNSNAHWENYPTKCYVYAESEIENCVFKSGCVGNRVEGGWVRVFGDLNILGQGGVN